MKCHVSVILDVDPLDSLEIFMLLKKGVRGTKLGCRTTCCLAWLWTRSLLYTTCVHLRVHLLLLLLFSKYMDQSVM